MKTLPMIAVSMKAGPIRRHAAHALAAGLAGLLSACAGVQMQPGAADVRVYPLAQSMAACQYLGELATSVTSDVGPYERNRLSVRDELETLARNEALTLHGNGVQPMEEPVGGHQRWRAYRCGSP